MAASVGALLENQGITLRMLCTKSKLACFFILILRFMYIALEATPSEEDLNEVSKEAGDGWRNLLRHLGVPEVKVDSLLEDHRSGNPVRACFEGLVFWREGNVPCRPPTWSVLLEAFEKGAEKREYARGLREKIVSRLTLITQQLEPASELTGDYRVKWGNLERPCKSSVNGKLQVKFSVCNISVN